MGRARCLRLSSMLQKIEMADSDGENSLSVPDRRRLERLFVQHHASVWRTLRRRGLSPAAAADATQETFMVAARRLADIQEQSERAFLVGTALRVAHTLRRKTLRWQLDDDMDQYLAGLPSRGADLADVQLCDLALSRVKPELAEAFVLHDVEGFSSPEIAALLGIPLGSVASRLRRGREQFRTALLRIQHVIEREGQP